MTDRSDDMPETRSSGVCSYCGKKTWWEGMCVLPRCEGHTERERTKPRAESPFLNVGEGEYGMGEGHTHA